MTGEGNGGKGNGGKNGGTLTIPDFTPPPLEVRERHNYTPYLVIRCVAGDYGGRPLPSGTVFWESPDVWVESSLGINQPVVGEANKVFARVTNYGLEQANGVVVKFWWSDPSIAITESTAHLIGIGFVDIPAKRSAVVECPKPWFPIEENGGHECLLAEAYVPRFDPLTAPMDPTLDRHVGQKNEQLVTLHPGGEFKFAVQTANLTPMHQTITLDFHSVRLERVPVLFEHQAALRDEDLSPPSVQLPLTVRVRASSGTFVAPSDAFARGLLALHAAEDAGCRPHSWVTREIELEPWESRMVDLSGAAPPDSEPGQTFMFRLIERIGPLVTGGYTVGILVV